MAKSFTKNMPSTALQLVSPCSTSYWGCVGTQAEGHSLSVHAVSLGLHSVLPTPCAEANVVVLTHLLTLCKSLSLELVICQSHTGARKAVRR